MKKLACKDIDPGIKCDYQASGYTVHEVVNEMFDHVETDHPEVLSKTSPDELKKKFEVLVHD